MADTATPNVRATPLVYFIEKKVTRLKQVHYCFGFFFFKKDGCYLSELLLWAVGSSDHE